MKYRICKGCDAEEGDGTPFPRHGRMCRKCCALRSKEYYQEHKEEVIARDAQYYQDNKERRSAQHAKYHQDNKKSINAQKRKEYHEQVESEQEVRSCTDCGAPMPKRARLYCTECREKHAKINAEISLQKISKEAKRAIKPLPSGV